MTEWSEAFIPQLPNEHRYVNDVDALLTLHAQLATRMPNSWWGFDLETTSKNDPWHESSTIYTAALSVRVSDGSFCVFGFSLDHPKDTETTDHELQRRVAAISQVLNFPSYWIVGQNVAQYDRLWWRVIFRSPFTAGVLDCRDVQSLLDENSENSLESNVARYVPEMRKNVENLDRRRLHQYETQKVLRYNMDDATAHLLVSERATEAATNSGFADLVAFDIERAQVVHEMTELGTNADRVFLDKQLDELAVEVQIARDKVENKLGGVSVTSPKQLANFLFGTDKDCLGISTEHVPKTSAGAYSTSKEALLLLKTRETLPPSITELIDDIQAFRKVQKLRNTYLRPYKTKHIKADGRIHGRYNISKGKLGKISSGAVTFRTSSSEPNMQNMPRDPRIRGILIPSEGYRLFDGDYSQIELRILAWSSQDPVMCGSYDRDEDLHSRTAAEIMGKSYDQVFAAVAAGDRYWDDQRTSAKRTNFGIPYGISPFRLMLQIWESGGSASEQSSATYIDKWKQRYAQANAQLERWQHEAATTGAVRSATGRLRRLPLAGVQGYVGGRQRRQAVNFPIQSFASDVLFVALILLRREFLSRGGARLIQTVHDSIVGEYDPDIWSDASIEEFVVDVMTTKTIDYMRKVWGIEGLNLAVDIKTGLTRGK